MLPLGPPPRLRGRNAKKRMKKPYTTARVRAERWVECRDLDSIEQMLPPRTPHENRLLEMVEELPADVEPVRNWVEVQHQLWLIGERLKNCEENSQGTSTFLRKAKSVQNESAPRS